ncbi:MAG: hypothetical protein AAF919_18670 [Pseudomonadota bacterium]
MRVLLLLALTLPAPAAADFVVLRCNTQVNGSTFTTSLRIRFPGGRVERIVGEDGLTDQIAFSAERAVAWTRATFPNETAGQRAFYDRNCGVRSDDNDDDD